MLVAFYLSVKAFFFLLGMLFKTSNLVAALFKFFFYFVLVS